MVPWVLYEMERLKCELSNILDRTEDHIANIRGIDDYQMPKLESEFYLAIDYEYRIYSNERPGRSFNF